jgi:hypothetical protein
MFKIFEFLGGVMFLVATIQFIVSPRKALQETYDVLVSPSPRMAKGHLVLPQKKNHKMAALKTSHR